MAFITKKLDFLAPDYTESKVTLTAAVVAGEFGTRNEVNGFYVVDGAIGDAATFITKCRKTKAAKVTGTAWAGGEAVYWVNATSNVSTAGDILIGYAAEDAASADTEGIINFDGTLAFAKL